MADEIDHRDAPRDDDQESDNEVRVRPGLERTVQ